MDILKLAEENKTGLVSRGGAPVTILFANARGGYPLVGLIHLEEDDRVVKWNLEGNTSSSFNSDSLVLWSFQKHFDWSILPGWANAYVYKVYSKWYCSSMAPVWDDINEKYVHKTREHCTMEIPDVVARDIKWTPTNKESLVKHPRYDDIQL